MPRLPISVLVLFSLSLMFSSSFSLDEPVTCSVIVPLRKREANLSIEEFGAVGDDRTLNTEAFKAAIDRIRTSGVGTLLHVPSGVYWTESFNLTSHMTLHLAAGAVIKSVQDVEHWPLIEPLPSYGRGRERPGPRHISFIHGDGLDDVVITGENGTIDGQGVPWWNLWHQKALKFTRPHLIEIKNSTNIVISNVVLQNAPFWTVHPVYCSNVVVRNVTILAPHDSPNSDGIDPDSSSNVCIEDCYVSNGDDIVAVKSGWDQYGIAYNRPSRDITIRRITGSTPFAGIAIGSETSGGIHNVTAEDITLLNSGIAIHIKTNAGRGGTIENIRISGIYMENVRTGIKISGHVGDHPDDKFDPKALPTVRNITIKDIKGVKVRNPGLVEGLRDSPFTNVCLFNVTLTSPIASKPWKCSDVTGGAVKVSPTPCAELVATAHGSTCGVQV